MSYYRSSSDGPSGWTIFFVIILIIGCLASCSRSCSDQSMARSWGGTIDVELEPNQKLVNVTWKDNSLWILTKDMVDEDVAENYTFYEKDVTGWLEGSVHINELKLTDEELAIYEEQKILEIDFYKSGNTSYSEETGETSYIFIEYDVENDTYIKIKDYTYDEYDGLVEIK